MNKDDNQINNESDLIEKARQAAIRSRNYSEAEERQVMQRKRNAKEQRRNNLPLVSPKDNRESVATQNTKNNKTRNRGKRKKRKENKQANQYSQTQLEQVDFLPEKSKNIYGYLLSIVMILLSIVVIGSMWIYSVLPIKSRATITVILIILSTISYFLAGKGQFSRKIRRFWNSFATVIVIVLVLIAYLLLSSIGFLNSLYAKYENVEFEVRVLAESSYQAMSDLNNETIGVVASEDPENIENVLSDLVEENNLNVNRVEYGSYPDSVAELYAGHLSSLLVNKANLALIKEVYPDFETVTRVLDTAIVKMEIKDLRKGVNTSKESFNVYISGIDTYGEISSVSRSDVNIVMTVDPTSKEILLTNIPRDTYVEIAGTNGGYDKLTHAGINGIETSINTISNFLGIDVNYFARVNFTSLIELVDVLGGIELDNPEAFPTRDGKHYFEQGRISLNGEQALAYSRERYNLAEGDIGRGKNQMRVIEAMIRKAISPEIIGHANELIAKFGDVAETNMPTRDISNLVNVELSTSEPWNFETQTLIGYGRNDLPSYNMPGQALYMYDPDPNSVNELKANIEAVLD
ncbi:MAG: LytR family transcriptional regulator [Clostridiaceae bacterium]|nr:LytR family transcriptional regulator [Clostridiaceae bacterium]